MKQIELIYILCPFTDTFHNVALHYPAISLEASGISEMIGLVFISVCDIFLWLHEGQFHQILYFLRLDRPWERRDWLRPRMNRLRSSLLSVMLLLTSSCEKKEKKEIHKRAQSGVAQLACPFLCVQLCVFPSAVLPLLSPSTPSSPPSSISPSLTLPPPLCLDHSIPLFLLPLHLPLSSECLCNSYSYLLVGARIRASLLMCSCSPRGRGDRENILKS